jgi:hypothetical protein
MMRSKPDAQAILSLPELLWFFSFPGTYRESCAPPTFIGRCLVEVRRGRSIICFINVKSVDRIIYSIFQRSNLEWKTLTLKLLTQAT